MSVAMPALTPPASPVSEGDSALVRVLEASIETLKAENVGSHLEVRNRYQGHREGS